MSLAFSVGESAQIRADFPILARTVRDEKPLVYLDSGATSQKPTVVLEAEREFYTQHNAAVHRGAHQLAEEATEAFEDARATIAAFLGGNSDEIVFTKNGTEAINLIAYAVSNAAFPGAVDGADPAAAARLSVGPGDEIVVTEMEHHANLVPWQELARRTGATLKWISIDEDGRLGAPESAISDRTKILAITHVSNVVGTRNDLAPYVAAAKANNAIVVVDACQSVPHLDVTDLTAADSGIDFVIFTGHKVLGPSGIGVLWGRTELLAAMPPFLTGGSMIEVVKMEGSTYAPPPQRFEAGVPVAAQAVGLAAAVKYLQGWGMDRVHAHDEALTAYALEQMATRPWLKVLGPRDAAERVGSVAFVVEGVHPHDVGQILDDDGIAVRTGHHCAWPLHRALGVPSSTRASFGIYTTTDEIDAMMASLDRVVEIFGVNS